MTEQNQVGLDAAAELGEGAIGGAATEGAMAKQRSRPGDVSVGKGRHGVAVADQPVGDLVLDGMLERPLGLAAEIRGVDDPHHAVPSACGIRRGIRQPSAVAKRSPTLLFVRSTHVSHGANVGV